jgi:hypothetical protein
MKLYTLNEASKLLGYANGNSLRPMIQPKRINAVKIGRDWFITQKEISRVIKEKQK